MFGTNVPFEWPYLYDIDDLKGVIEFNKAEREKKTSKADRMVEAEVIKFHGLDGIFECSACHSTPSGKGRGSEAERDFTEP